MSTALSLPATKKNNLREMLYDPTTFASFGHALGGWMTADEFMSQILISFSEPRLQECTVQSKYVGAHVCAALRLLPAAQHVAIIPRKATIGDKRVVQATVMPQWQGYKSLMERVEAVLEVSYQLVHVRDEFSWDQDNNRLHHDFSPFDPERNWSEDLDDMQGIYVTVVYTDGRPKKFHFITRSEILKRRACALTMDVWRKWPKEQAIKSAYRDTFQRRIVPFDPVGEAIMQNTSRADDRVLENNPDRVPSQGATVEGQVISPPTRAEQISGNLSVSQFSSPSPPLQDTTLDIAPDDTPIIPSDGNIRGAITTELSTCTSSDQVTAVYELYANKINETDQDWFFGETEDAYGRVKPEEGENPGRKKELESLKAKIDGYKQQARLRLLDEEIRKEGYTSDEITLVSGWIAARLANLDGRLV